MSNAVARQNGVPENRIVRALLGREFQGFLFTADTTPTYRAHYVDGVVETIDPTSGLPRPDPDNAVRTKFLKLLAPLDTGGSSGKIGSKFSGQMRRAVQCYNSQAKVVPFSHTYAKTHGILEWPFPRVVGATVEEERTNAAARRFWIVEISASGVYAAPVAISTNCLRCAAAVSQYLQAADNLSLAWAFDNNNAAGQVKRLLTAGEIASAYVVNVVPWHSDHGWAFSYSGLKASAVVVKRVVEAALSSFTVDLLSEDATFYYYRINCTGGLFVEREIVKVVITSPAHTGYLPLSNAGADSFEIRQPKSSGAITVGNVTITRSGHYRTRLFDLAFTVDLTDPELMTFDLSAVLTPATEKHLNFAKRLGGRSLLWKGAGNFIAEIPYYGTPTGAPVGLFFPEIADAPIFVYYKGEAKVLVRFRQQVFDEGAHEGVRLGFLTDDLDHIVEDSVAPTRWGASSAALFSGEREAVGLFKAEMVVVDTVEVFSGSMAFLIRSELDAIDLDVSRSAQDLEIANPSLDEMWFLWNDDVPAADPVTTDLYALGGGLFYDDPLVPPAGQKTNRVYKFDDDIVEIGGFTALSGSEKPVAFIGQV